MAPKHDIDSIIYEVNAAYISAVNGMCKDMDNQELVGDDYSLLLIIFTFYCQMPNRSLIKIE